MTNPLTLKCILQDDQVCLDVINNIKDCFIYSSHVDAALHNVTLLKESNKPEDKNNIFGIYRKNTIIGVTGLWYDDNSLFKDFAFLRWTGLIENYRGLRLFPYVIDLLSQEATRNKKSHLIEIAHTKNAKEAFENNGFELIPNNDKHLEFVLNLLGEDKGNYILVNSITNDFIDWDLLHKCYNDKIEYYIPEERKRMHRKLVNIEWQILTDTKELTPDMCICIVNTSNNKGLFINDPCFVSDIYFYDDTTDIRYSHLATAVANNTAYYRKYKLTGEKYEKVYKIEYEYNWFNVHGINVCINDNAGES